MKFSGGKSSGMLLLLLLEHGALQAARGDVVVFNNTSAEHPETYRFVTGFQQLVENRFGIPFFWIEFQTYEDARNGYWTRLPSYRMVTGEPWTETSRHGYRSRGEVFEELLSWSGFVPNIFQRTCTKHLKLETTRAFLSDWFAGRSHTERLGHFGHTSRIDDNDLIAVHRKHRGTVPDKILLKKKAFVRSCPVFRPAQEFSSFSKVAHGFKNPRIHDRVVGNEVHFGEGEVEYLAFVGLRHDEQHRVIKVHKRNKGGHFSEGHEGEHIYTPLDDIGITQRAVEAFWEDQGWGLNFNADDGLSNCTFCFLKGTRWLQAVGRALQATYVPEYENTPCDLDWWIRIENKYGRDLVAEGRRIRNENARPFIGFFGRRKFSYESLKESTEKDLDLSKVGINILPCDCTD